MSQQDDLTNALASLQTELDAAKARDEAIQAKLADVSTALANLQANPPSGPDLSAAIASVQADVTEAQSIGQPPASA